MIQFCVGNLDFPPKKYYSNIAYVKRYLFAQRR